jgi:proteasome beta subunit
MITATSKSFTDLVGGLPSHAGLAPELEVHGTTVLSLRYKEGVLTLADRRATAGNLVMYDQAEKIVPLDDYTVIAISGAFARSVEVCRFLKHSFKYYRRITQNEMSLDGKLMEISRALANNMAAAMQGMGVFLPIVSAYDRNRNEFGVYFFDGAGARFQNHAYACAGSGSERIRGLFEYLARSKGPWQERPLKDVLADGLEMLDIAADLDSATGGFSKTLPVTRVLDADGNRPVPEDELRRAVDKVLKGQ